MNRREFLKTGLMTGAVLATGTQLYGCSDLDIVQLDIINDEVGIALAAVLPVMLAGALPEDPAQRKQRILDTIAA